MFDQRKDPPERVFSQCARVDSNHHGLLAHKALNPNHPAWIRFLASEGRKMTGFLHGLDALDRMDVATSVATDLASPDERRGLHYRDVVAVADAAMHR
jgi:hypothetical protein